MLAGLFFAFLTWLHLSIRVLGQNEVPAFSPLPLLFALFVFALARSVTDLREKRYAWASVGVVCAVLPVLLPLLMLALFAIFAK